MGRGPAAGWDVVKIHPFPVKGGGLQGSIGLCLSFLDSLNAIRIHLGGVGAGDAGNDQGQQSFGKVGGGGLDMRCSAHLPLARHLDIANCCRFDGVRQV